MNGQAHVPLCVEVSFDESAKHFCFSVHEATLHYYSCLGRVFVTYNSSANTWHCLCAKPRMSCVHKNIGKWHLFQKNQDVFRTEETSTSTPQKHQDTVYPPSAELFKRLVQCIHAHKRLPANLPDDLVRPKPVTDYVTELHPVETVCALCPGTDTVLIIYSCFIYARCINLFPAMSTVSHDLQIPGMAGRST